MLWGWGKVRTTVELQLLRSHYVMCSPCYMYWPQPVCGTVQLVLLLTLTGNVHVKLRSALRIHRDLIPDTERKQHIRRQTPVLQTLYKPFHRYAKNTLRVNVYTFITKSVPGSVV